MTKIQETSTTAPTTTHQFTSPKAFGKEELTTWSEQAVSYPIHDGSDEPTADQANKAIEQEILAGLVTP